MLDEKTQAQFDRHARGWEATVETVEADGLAAALDKAEVIRNRAPLEDNDARAAGDADAFHDVDDEVHAQLAAAVEAVKAIVASGALGSGQVTAAIKGFANPGNEPLAGHPADYVTVQVGRIAPDAD